MNIQANRFGIKTAAFAVILLATLAGCVSETSSRPIKAPAAMTPVNEALIPAREALNQTFHAQADAAAFETRREITADLAVRILGNEKLLLASNHMGKRG